MMRISCLAVFAAPVALLALPAATAAAADKPTVCYQATVALSTVKQQRAAIVDSDRRYTAKDADAYYAVAKRYGDDFVQYQVHYLAERSGSLSFDLYKYNGIKDTGKETGGATTKDCTPPLVWLVGLKPVAIEGKAIDVTEQRGLFSVVALGKLTKQARPHQLKMAGSGKLLCKDFRRDMGFGVDSDPCLDLSAKVRAARKKR